MPLHQHELHNYNLAVLGAAPVVVSDTTPVVSAIQDTRGFETLEFFILTGVLVDVDATFAVTMTAGDVVDSETAPTSITDSASADSGCVLGLMPSFTFAADSSVLRVGYSPAKGNGKRWVRLTVTPAANTGAAPLAILVLKQSKLRPINT